jgi:anti-sigma B factor antagonist
MSDPQESIIVSTRWEESRAIIELSGELDLHSSPQLGSAVEDALGRSATAVEIDAATLSFADSAGLRALLLARSDADERGVPLKLTRVSEPLRRLLEMTGLREALGVPVT